VRVAVLALFAAGLAAYHNSFSVPFLFDDDPSILNNPTIWHLWPPWGMLSPPATGAPVTNRPVPNVTLALNFAFGGLHVEGYHIFNLAAHLLTGALLFGVVRRTLRRPPLAERYAEHATSLAWLSALLWLVHPVLTESVTYVVSRTEVLMALFYLATLYSVIRSADSARPAPWRAAAVASCLAGMASKEVMVTAPLMALLYDRTFIAGSFRAAWTRRKGLYLSLMCTWLLLAWLMISGGNRGGSTGFKGTIAWWQYLFTQFTAIVRYLRLSFWPNPLILDYGTFVARNPATIIFCGLLVVGLFAATLVALVRRPVWGFPGAWFFGILAPSSSVVPVLTQTMAEHRIYLALPALIVPLILALHGRLGKWSLPVGLAVAIALAAATVARNRDYRSARSIWADNVAKWPGEPRPHLNLGLALMTDPQMPVEAVRQLEEVLRLKPDYPLINAVLGSFLSAIPGREAEADSAFKKELRLEPKAALGHLNYGIMLAKIPGRENDAARELRIAIGMKTDDVTLKAQAHSAYGSLLVKIPGRRAEGMAELRKAVALYPDLGDLHASLGVALSAEDGGLTEAVGELEKAGELRPDSAEIRTNLATVLEKIPDRREEAVSNFEEAVLLNPFSWQAHYDLGKLLLEVPGRVDEGIAQLETVTRLAPGFADAHTSLGVALSGKPGRFDESVREFEAAALASPGSEDAHFNLGAALAQLPGRQRDAAEQFQTALRLNPGDADARYRLACIYAGMPGRTADAVGQLREALRLAPGNSAAAELLAKIHPGP
jgi:tetratricopeptide (TPR) repeat protein